MKVRITFSGKEAILLFLMALPLLTSEVSADEQRQATKPQLIRLDTASIQVHRGEIPQRSRMMSSPLPVEIRQQGRQLCIKSRYAQLLPIYTASGIYYSSLRLNKGTNWLTGLPRGAYVINNHRYTIN